MFNFDIETTVKICNIVKNVGRALIKKDIYAYFKRNLYNQQLKYLMTLSIYLNEKENEEKLVKVYNQRIL